MKVTLISKDNQLLREFEKSEMFDSITQMIDAIPVDSLEGDVFVVSDMLLNSNELMYQCQVNKGKKTIFYMLSNRRNAEEIKNIQYICESYKVVPIPPKMTVEQIVAVIIKYLFPKNQETNKAALFIGADEKVGVTMTAQSVAECTAKNSELKVGFLCLTPKRNNTYMENVNSIDALKSKLLNDLVTKNDILETCTKKDNLYLLSGVANYLEMRKYSLQYIEKLLKMALEVFDVIIVDGGSSIDNPLTVGALRFTNNVLFVTTQQESAKTQYDNMSGIYDNLLLNRNNFLLVVNKLVEQAPFLTATQIAEHTKMQLAGTIDYVGNSHETWLPETEKKTFYSYEIPEYQQQISIITKIISKRLGFVLDLPDEEPKKNIFGFLKRSS